MTNPTLAIATVGAEGVSLTPMPMNGNEKTAEFSREISLYFHIPFCKKKCSYCHFYVIPDKENSKDDLLSGFLGEWDAILPIIDDKRIVSIYFGGGTPSLFGPHRLSQLLKHIKTSSCVSSQSEMTLEVNPENVDINLIEGYVDCGINRMSIGIQTLDRQLLHLLGRNHQPETAIEAIHTIYRAGIHNLSVDLIYDLPSQNLQDWIGTLDIVKKLPITHLSLYNLTIEPHTLFFKNQEQLRPLIPDEETSLAMYETAIEKLESCGYKQYEISAFAIPGYESLHNSGYWLGRPFLGFGPSAFSYWENRRFQNVANLQKYLHQIKEGSLPRDYIEELTPDARRRELLAIQLRLKIGVNLDHFESLHGSLDKDTIKTIKNLLSDDFLTIKNDRLTLTKKGTLFYDSVATDLI